MPGVSATLPYGFNAQHPTPDIQVLVIPTNVGVGEFSGDFAIYDLYGLALGYEPATRNLIAIFLAEASARLTFCS